MERCESSFLSALRALLHSFHLSPTLAPQRTWSFRWGFHEKAFNVKANVVAWRRLLRRPAGDAPHPNLLSCSFSRRGLRQSLRRPGMAVRFARLPFALWGVRFQGTRCRRGSLLRRCCNLHFGLEGDPTRIVPTQPHLRSHRDAPSDPARSVHLDGLLLAPFKDQDFFFFRSGGRRSSSCLLPRPLIQRFVHLPGQPQVMQQHGQLAGHRHHRPPLAPLSPPRR